MVVSMDEVVVGFGIDPPFACHLGVTIASIIRSTRGCRFRFIVAHKGVDLATRKKVEACAAGHEFSWHEVEDTRIARLKGGGWISQATYYRLVLPNLAPESATRLLYLDSDVVVRRPLTGLWASDLCGRSLGAVFDPFVDADAFAKKQRLPYRRLGYFNAGVLVLNLTRIREEASFIDVVDFLASAEGEPRFHDQDALNVRFWNDWQPLDPTWNVQRAALMRTELQCFAEDEDLRLDHPPSLVHYTSDSKPWRTGTHHPFAWAYLQVARGTPFWPEICAAAKGTGIASLKWQINYAVRWPLTQWLFDRAPRLAYQPKRSIESWRADGLVEH